MKYMARASTLLHHLARVLVRVALILYYDAGARVPHQTPPRQRDLPTRGPVGAVTCNTDRDSVLMLLWHG